MSDVLDRIRRELQQRLESTRAAAQEHERVRAALEALEHAAKPFDQATRRAASEAGRRSRSLASKARPTSSGGGSETSTADVEGASSGATAQRAARPRKTGSATRARSADPTSKPQSRSRAAAKPARQRAAPGANREAVLAVVRDRPGVTTRELAAASGVTGGTLYALLRRLTEQGVLVKRELPGGQTGYAIGPGDAGISDTSQPPVAGPASSRGRTSEPREIAH